MTVLWWIVMMAAGSAGALCRWRMDLLVRGWASNLAGVRRARARAEALDAHSDRPARENPPELALGIVAVNIAGCLLAGLLYGWLGGVHTAWLIAGTGFLGGFTTFSTAMVDVLTQLRSRRPAVAGALLIGTWIAGIAACLGGLALTGAL